MLAMATSLRIAAALVVVGISTCSAQMNLPTYKRLTTPDTTPARTSFTTISTEYNTGSAMFIGGVDADRNTLPTTTTITHTGSGSFTFNTQTSTFTPLKGATTVSIAATGRNGAANLADHRTFVLGGFNAVTGVPTMTVATYDGSTGYWNGSTGTVITAGGSMPPGRTGAAAAYLTRCDMSIPASPKPCLLMVGGQGASGLLNDVWALWTSEAVPRWEMIEKDTPTPTASQPTRRTQAVGAGSSDGSTMFVYGGVTATGPTADMYALAPSGFSDAVYDLNSAKSEYYNIAVRTTARESSTANYWGDRGAGAAVDGNLRTDFDASGYPFACTHTNNELTPWWRTKLNYTTTVDAIRISPRTDCCTDRTRQYRVFTHTSDPSNGPPPPGYTGAEVTDPMPNLAGSPILVPFIQPRNTLFLWVQLRNLNWNRPLTLCEVEVLKKKTWVWRKLSGLDNVALQKPASQSSQLTNWTGGEAPRAVDGIVSTNYNTAPATCTHTNGVPAVMVPWWQVDLGAVYQVSQIRLWPRMDCCSGRNANWFIHVGNSANNFVYDTVFLRDSNVNLLPSETTSGKVINNLAKGRYVTVRRPNFNGGEDSIIQICEIQIFAERMMNQPVAVRDFSSVIFRGNLVTFGGNDANGFRMDSLRFFNLDTRVWAPAFVPLGTGPGSRAFTGLVVIDATRLLMYGGITASDVMSDVNVVEFPTCAGMDAAAFTSGVEQVRCLNGGTSCIVKCYAGGQYADQNKGMPIVCREDGLVDGQLPPCKWAALADPTSVTSVNVVTIGANANTSVTVNWNTPTAGQLAGGTLKGFRVSARPREFLETFENGFVNPAAWRVFNATQPTSSTFYFKDGSLYLDGGAGTDYWAWCNNENINNGGLTVNEGCQVRNGYILYRDWPAEVDVQGEWSIESEVTADTMPSGSGMTIGLLDLGLNAGRGEVQFFWGYRYTDWGDAGVTLTLGLESLGGRTARIFPALANRVFLRIEKVKYSTADRDVMGTAHGVLRVFYKYTAGAPWCRVYDTITYRETINSFYSTSACATSNCIAGNGMRWANIRPYFFAKSRNNNLYARAVGSFKYLKITSGVEIARQPVTRYLAHPGPGYTYNNTILTGMSRGVTYNVDVETMTEAGYGRVSTTVVNMPAAVVSAANIVWGSKEAAYNRPSFQFNTYANDVNNWGAQKGNNGNWLDLFHTEWSFDGQWWAVDLGVDFAAVKHIQLRNRCGNQGLARRLHHPQVYIGQNPIRPWSNNVAVDQTLWDNYTTIDPAIYRWWEYPNYPPRTIWQATDSGPNRALAFFAHSGAAANGNPAYCRATIPTPGYGRYLFVANGAREYYHLHEVAVHTANNCPARASYGPVTSVTIGSRSCAANQGFGTQCEQACSLGNTLISGTPIAICNGEQWTGGFAAPVMCGSACPDLDPPAFAERMEHVIIDEDMRTWSAGLPNIRERKIISLNALESPLATSWARIEGGVQALGRLGTPVEPTMVFAIDKIRAMDATGTFFWTTTFSTADRAGLLFRVVDPKNYYRAYLDIPSGLHKVDAVVNGVPREMSKAYLALQKDTPVLLGVSVSGYDYNVTVNGRLLMQVSDRQFPQGYVGLYAQSVAMFTNVKFSRYAKTCAGAHEGEKCVVTCQAGLTNLGSPLTRTCQNNALWQQPTTIPSKCTLDPPIFPVALLSVKENSARNALVGTPLVAQSTSPGYPVQYQILDVYIMKSNVALYKMVNGADLFSVDFCSGQVKVRQNDALDFEFIDQYSVTVRAYVVGFTDAFTDRNITVNIVNVDEPPVVVTSIITFSEDTASGTNVGSVTWWDPENDTVTFAVDVDGSAGKVALHPSLGNFKVIAQPTNSSGFTSMFTGNDAPLNFERVGDMELSLTITQTTCLKMACGTLPALTGTGMVALKTLDANDPPSFGAGTQLFRIREAASQVLGSIVGAPSVDDEDQGLFNVSLVYTQVDPSNCGVTNKAQFPVTDYPTSSTAGWTASNNLFAVDSSTGEIKVARLPGRGYGTAVSGADNWPAYVYDNVLVRANFMVCISVTDTLAITVRAVDVVIQAEIPDLPTVEMITPALFPTNISSVVNITGVNFVIGQTVSAWYSNGVNTYNATSCRVAQANSILCNTVIGVGMNMVWKVVMNSKFVYMEYNTASYMAPEVYSVTGNTNMVTSGQTVTINGLYFGPTNTGGRNPISIVYGADYSIPCNVVTQNDRRITCTSSGQAGGANLPYRVFIGGYMVTSSDLFSYGAPTISSIKVVDATNLLSTAGGTMIRLNGTNFGGNSLTVASGHLVTSFGLATGKLLDLSCFKVDAITAHKYMECHAPPGAGMLHAVMVVVAGVPMVTAFGALRYTPPVITSISGQGYANGDTSGGQVITFVGKNFGPKCFGKGSCEVMILPDGITYGSDGDIYTRYTAMGCQVTAAVGDVGEITCLSSEGVGKNMRYMVKLGGQVISNVGAMFPELGSIHRLGSYSPPNIAAFNGQGSYEADTRGAEEVIITGRNFGPADAYTNTLLAVSYGVDLQNDITNATAVVIGSVLYTAGNCRITRPHTEVTCNSVAGAGSQLAWDVVVAAQKSATPTTSYHAPVITDITYEDGSAVIAADVDGGEWIVLTGDFFGPVAYAATQRSLVQSVTYGQYGTEYEVAEVDWLILGHDKIKVRTQPGSGLNLLAIVTVADQISSCPLARFSYAVPAVVSITPSVISTFSNPDQPTLIRLAVKNLPLRDPRSKIAVIFSNRIPKMITPAVPQGIAAIERARNPDRSVNIEFTLDKEIMHGGGLMQKVVIAILPSTSNMPSLTSAQDASSVVNYRDPVIQEIIVTKVRWVENATANEALKPCPFVSGPAPWTCNEPDLYEVSLEGKDFSDDRSDMTSRLIEREYLNPLDGLMYWSSVPLWLVSWEHHRIVTYTILRNVVSGNLRINITSTAYDGSSQSQSLAKNFTQVSPDIGNIVGGELPFATAGGDMQAPLIMTTSNLDNARGLRVLIGNRPATLLQRVGTVYAPIANIVAWVAANKDAQGEWTLYVQVPAGQGSLQSVKIEKTTSEGIASSSPRFTIDYRKPIMTHVQTIRKRIEGAKLGWDGYTTVTVPTDGVSARVRIYGTDLGIEPAITAGDRYTLHGADVVPCTITPAPDAHTCYEFTAPEGEGSGLLIVDGSGQVYPLGFRMSLAAGDQRTADTAWRYEAPVVNAVVSVDNKYPTRGGVALEVQGENFGARRYNTLVQRDPSVIKVEFGWQGSTPVLWTECLSVQRSSHMLMNCTLPEGSGLNLAVRMSVAGLEATLLSVFSYDKPVISHISVMQVQGDSFVQFNSTMEAGFTNPASHGRTAGGDLITITGTNFGAYNINGSHCAFFTWAYRRVDSTRIHTCNNAEDFLGEGEVPASSVVTELDVNGVEQHMWTHNKIVLRTPPGVGYKDIELSIRGRTLGFAQENVNLWRFVYNAPIVTGTFKGYGSFNGIIASGEPTGKFDTEGGETITFSGDNFGPTLRDTSLLENQLQAETFTNLAIGDGQALPMAVVGVVFHKACISSARTIFGGRPAVYIPTGATQQTLEQCDSRVFKQEHDKMTFVTGAGIGRNRTAYIVVVDGPHVQYSNKITVNYYEPMLSSYRPYPVYMMAESQSVDIIGKYFGNAELAGVQGWTPEELAFGVVVGGLEKSCMSVSRSREEGETKVSCVVDETLVPAGYRNVSLTVAGQTGRAEAYAKNRLLLVCKEGFYGHVNETCVECPAQDEDPAKRGAVCKGYAAATADFETRFTYPRPLKGWYNLNSSDKYTNALADKPNMMPACPPGFQHMGRDVCIVPCDPQESCLGDNLCAEGYTSKAPMFRCAYCDKGFYKRSGECVKCPDSPAALFVGFILLVIVVAGVGFLLNRKQINIAVISIGVDFFQVLAIFATARIKWPPIVKEILHVLSAFNLNIEIVAPECLVPDISYKQKFWFIMVLPVTIAGLFALNYYVMVAYKALIIGQPKKMWHSHRPALVSSCLVLLYLLYLYLTRTIFDVFNCAPTFPPDGKEYLQVVFEECGIPGGTQRTLLPFAIAGLAVYTCGYPAFIAWTIWSNKELVMEDQLLRAKNTGQDKLTNPRGFEFRCTFGRSYFQFKPDWCMWILAIILRKFFIAITAVVFGKNSSFQMAACLLIMFVAYAAQVQIRPYMGPGDFDEVLASHTAASYSSAIHARLRSTLAGIEARGRKKGHKNLVNFEGKFDKNAVFGVLTGFFFNYNTVEAIMQFCAVIVCLMAIMYQANELSSYYPQSKDSVTAVLMIIIIWAIVYFFTVFITEVVVLYNEDNRAKQLAKQSRNGRGDKAKGVEADDAKSRRMAKQGDVEVNIGNVDNTTNPMFLNQNNQASLSAGDVTESLLTQKDSPPTELWRVFQSNYVEMTEQVKSLQAQLQAAKKAQQLGTGDAAEGDAVDTKSRNVSRTEFAPKGTTEEVSKVNPMARAASGKGASLASMREASTRSIKAVDE